MNIISICLFQGRQQGRKQTADQMTDEEKEVYHEKQLSQIERNVRNAEKELDEKAEQIEKERSTIADHRKYIGEYMDRCKALRVELRTKKDEFKELEKKQNELVDKMDGDNSDELKDELVTVSKQGRQISKDIDRLKNDEQQYLGIVLGNSLAMSRSFNHFNGRVHQWLQCGQKVSRFGKIFVETAGYIDKSKLDTYKPKDTSVKIVKKVREKPTVSQLHDSIDEPTVSQLQDSIDEPTVSQLQDSIDEWGSDDDQLVYALDTYEADVREHGEEQDTPEVSIEPTEPSDGVDNVPDSPIDNDNNGDELNTSEADDAILDGDAE